MSDTTTKMVYELGIMHLVTESGVIMDVEKGTIQMRQKPRNNIQILPLTLVNML
jgi:hypothetical protein